MTALYVILALLAGAALYVVFAYNRLVSLRVRVNESWSGIEVQMKRWRRR